VAGVRRTVFWARTARWTGQISLRLTGHFNVANALAAIAVAAIAHMGAFLGGSGYGTPTGLPWAVTFTNPNSSAPLGIPLHPTQLYESALDLALLAGLRSLGRCPGAPGQQFLAFLLGSALIRLAVDPVKADVIMIGDTLTSGQLMAAIVLAGGGLWLGWGAMARPKGGEHET
jgi:phosphatidylglycerol:prolipoprotein diacylglycerol transferase